MELVADLHVHTVASGHAYSTIVEIAQAAAGKGLAMVAITDHGPAMPGAPHLYHFGNLTSVPRHICGVEILRGVEANIIDADGNIDLPPAYLDRLDIVLAGFHPVCSPEGSVAENTTAMINAMKNPYVDIIVHPGNPEYPVDTERIVAAAGELGVVLEINNSSLTHSRPGSAHNCQAIADCCRRRGVRICIGSDSHIALTVGEFDAAVAMVEAACIPKKQVLNTSREEIRAYLGRRRPGR